MSPTADFRHGVTVQRPATTDRQFVADIAEMVGFHATNILPMLNGFQGYAAIDYKVVKKHAE